MWNPHIPTSDGIGAVTWGANAIAVMATGETSNPGAWLFFDGDGSWPVGERVYSIAFNQSLDGYHPGFTAFDRSFGGNDGTAGSGAGVDFSAGASGYNGTITGIYSDPVALGPNAPVGDLFLRFTMQFGDGTYANAFQGGGFKFSLDTDHIGAITAVPAVPEPASLMLLGTGLAGLAIRRRRGRA